jgi:hypothetical protein
LAIVDTLVVLAGNLGYLAIAHHIPAGITGAMVERTSNASKSE